MTDGYRDSETGLMFPAVEQLPFAPQYTPTKQELEEALKPMILSASGWRKVFAASGNEEDSGETLTVTDKVLCAGMAFAFHRFLQDTTRKSAPRVCVGLDSRFTGPAMADIMIRVFLALGAEVEYLGIVAAPEIMGYVQLAGSHEGFAYVSASHNPIGHNGIKFGLSNGGVVGGALAQNLIASFKTIASDEAQAKELIRLANTAEPDKVRAVYDALSKGRKASRAAYLQISDEILTLEGPGKKQESHREDLSMQIKQSGVGIVAEFNGSARCISIDKTYLESLGVLVKTVNDRPRQFTHRIVPEGHSLDLCREELEKAHTQDRRYVLGYVPDCDGDRGNVVYFNDRTQKAEILEAQEVFALCVLSELAGLVYFGHLTFDEQHFSHERVAVACNDPTSLRIDRIAEAFGASVFRAEVGEANVVNLARNLRTQGWTVRILGEGSNGGNITHPGSVRDPLSTLGSLLKLLALRGTAEEPGLFEIWCHRSGRPELYKEDYSLADIIATLPAFTTTSAYEDRAILKINTAQHSVLKAAYEKVFLGKGWKDNQAFLNEKLGIYGWEEINYEGMEERRGFGPPFRSGKETGGFKILLKNRRGQPIGCIWMRGSGTEPVFRVLADIEGSEPWKEEWLLNWHVGMIREVD